MEASHFVAGPWFTVERSGGEWEPIDTVWLSDGERTVEAHVEIKMELENET